MGLRRTRQNNRPGLGRSRGGRRDGVDLASVGGTLRGCLAAEVGGGCTCQAEGRTCILVVLG